MEDNIIVETLEYTDELYKQAIRENDFPEPDDGIGGNKNEDN